MLKYRCLFHTRCGVSQLSDEHLDLLWGVCVLSNVRSCSRVRIQHQNCTTQHVTEALKCGIYATLSVLSLGTEHKHKTHRQSIIAESIVGYIQKDFLHRYTLEV